MSGGGLKNIVKNGWHPEKDGSSLVDSVKGLVGRGDKSTDRENHVVTPISSLRDPSSFGPPPKHVAAYGPAAAHAQPTTRTASPSYTPAQSPSYATPPVASQTYSAVQPYQAQTQHVEEEPPAEPRPYRVDTTGLSTSHLPPPPRQRDGTAERAYSPTPTTTAQIAKPKVPPSLPPRLPPRSGTSAPSQTLAGGQAISLGQLNQGAIDRLGASGISVPGLGIGGGRTHPPPSPPPSGARPLAPLPGLPTQAPSYGQVDEVHARFARLGASSSSQASSSGTAVDGTRQGSVGQIPSVLGKKKPPPPPAPKKPRLSGTMKNAEVPPPIPVATRPSFD
ncbi:hypothetical protein HD806DRAFT_16215 [Xylariaceae sp. AK1471]|nr:hypothetical protein HD806DRAFT_16215 [Xylariaceae sp. AK1471]